jgi:hypothetical protein
MSTTHWSPHRLDPVSLSAFGAVHIAPGNAIPEPAADNLFSVIGLDQKPLERV